MSGPKKTLHLIYDRYVLVGVSTGTEEQARRAATEMGLVDYTIVGPVKADEEIEWSAVAEERFGPNYKSSVPYVGV